MTSYIPKTVFQTRVRDASIAGPNPFKWQPTTTAEIFNEKTVVVLPLRALRRIYPAMRRFLKTSKSVVLMTLSACR